MLALEAAIEAGNAIMEIYSQDFEVLEKADKSPLTAADTASHHIIKVKLDALGIPVLSEEGKSIPYAERKSWKQFWMVDPLDGTKEFVKKNGDFTVNIAMIENGIPTMGVVYAPAKNLLYYGAVGSGAYKVAFVQGDALNSIESKAEKLPVSRKNGKYVVVASRSHMSDETLEFVERLKKQNREVEFLNIGSSLKLCLVAEGQANIYPRLGPTMEWDTAAAHAVCLAAGVSVNEYPGGTPLKYNKENLLNPFFVVG